MYEDGNQEDYADGFAEIIPGRIVKFLNVIAAPHYLKKKHRLQPTRATAILQRLTTPRTDKGIENE